MSDILNSMYPFAGVVAATGMNEQTIKSHIIRNNVIGEGGRIVGGGGRGKRRGFSFYTIIELRFAKVLIDIGLSTEIAFRMAQLFAHNGTHEAAFRMGEKEKPSREPALPYHYALGETYLCSDGQKDAVVLRRKLGGQIEDFDEALSRRGRGISGECLIRVDAWPYFDSVVRSLNGSPFDLVDDAYNIRSGVDLERFA